MSLQQAYDVLKEIYELCQCQGLILRFHALRALQKVGKDGNSVIPWKLVIGHREAKADRMHSLVSQLCNSEVTQLILLRREALLPRK